jgi:hypothetical protein
LCNVCAFVQETMFVLLIQIVTWLRNTQINSVIQWNINCNSIAQYTNQLSNSVEYKHGSQNIARK